MNSIQSEPIPTGALPELTKQYGEVSGPLTEEHIQTLASHIILQTFENGPEITETPLKKLAESVNTIFNFNNHDTGVATIDRQLQGFESAQQSTQSLPLPKKLDCKFTVSVLAYAVKELISKQNDSHRFLKFYLTPSHVHPSLFVQTSSEDILNIDFNNINPKTLRPAMSVTFSDILTAPEKPSMESITENPQEQFTITRRKAKFLSKRDTSAPSYVHFHPYSVQEILERADSDRYHFYDVNLQFLQLIDTNFLRSKYLKL